VRSDAAEYVYLVSKLVCVVAIAMQLRCAGSFSYSIERYTHVHACAHVVFTFAFSPGGDFVTCGDDGFLRIFSRNPAKTGSERVQQLQQELALAVRAAAERSATGPSAEEIAKAPMWEERAQHPGKSADQVRHMYRARFVVGLRCYRDDVRVLFR
jgi:hypothetical protein